jgi:hypothetical protein
MGGLFKALSITHIANEIAHAGMIETLLHLKLLEFVPGKNNDLSGLIAFEQNLSVLLSKRAGASGDQDDFIVKHGNSFA